MHGTFYVTHAVGRRWIAGGHRGNVVSITVTWVRNGSPYVVPSAMSKSAIHAMTMSLAAEWGRYGIRLNTIAPGEIPTEGMSKRIKPGDEAGARTKAVNPMGRVGTMEELQNLAVFLISGGCDWINGETIAMDGAQALATGGNFYQLRDWSDADWNRRATRSRRRTKRTARSGDNADAARPSCALRTRGPSIHSDAFLRGSAAVLDRPVRPGDDGTALRAPMHRTTCNSSTPRSVLSLLPNGAKLLRNENKLTTPRGETCPLRSNPPRWPTWCARRRRRAATPLAFEFEGAQHQLRRIRRHTNQVANALIALGVKPRERIAYLGKNSDIYFELLMGAMKASVVMAPVNWRLAGPEIAFIVEDCQARGAVRRPRIRRRRCAAQAATADRHDHHRHRRRRAGMAGFCGLARRAARRRPRVAISRKDIAIQLYTSGTTGKPKGAMLSPRQFPQPGARPATTSRSRTGTNGATDDVSLVAMPIFHIGGSGWGIMGLVSRRQGRDRPRVRSDQGARFLRAVRHHQDVHGAGRDAVRGAAAARAPGRFLPAEIHALRRLADPGGAAEGMHRGVRMRLRADVRHDRDHRHHRRAAARGPRRAARSACAPPARRCPASSSRSSTPTASRCRRAKSARSPPAPAPTWPATGTCRKRPPRRIDADGWLRTGDAGYMDEDGYLYIHDRVKDMIISGGENIYPAEVESAICGHPDVAEVAVIGVPDDKWGEAVKAVVVMKPGKQPTAHDIIDFTRERIAGFKTPKSVDFIEALPRNASGKILRRNLREPYWAGKDRQVN